MSAKVFGSIAVCVLVSLTALGCTGEVVVRTAPPAERVEVMGVAPSAEHIWIKGHWLWDGAAYVWHPGHWELRRVGFVWQEPHWVARGSGFVFVEGRWIAH
jgi:WXXGXW repeat (2 copies)